MPEDVDAGNPVPFGRTGPSLKEITVSVNPARYIAAINECLGHWPQTNLALGGTVATDLKLKGNYTLANLTADRDALTLKITDVQAKLNLREDSAADRDLKKRVLRGRLGEFRAAVNYALQGTAYINGLPRVPDLSRAEGVFLKSLDDMLTKWTQINALVGVPNFTAPLTLLGGYTLAQFTTDLNALRAVFAALKARQNDLAIAVRSRDDAFKPIYARLKEYQLAVRARFGPTHPLVTSLPRLTPATGAPAAVRNPLAFWDKTLNRAVFTYDASISANVSGYELRFSPSDPYDSENETPVTAVGPDVLRIETTFGLPNPGSEGRFKIYTERADGGERGSRALRVKRPA